VASVGHNHPSHYNGESGVDTTHPFITMMTAEGYNPRTHYRTITYYFTVPTKFYTMQVKNMA